MSLMLAQPLAAAAGGGPVSRYWCWHCELWQGDEEEPLEASRLCPHCAAGMGVSK